MHVLIITFQLDGLDEATYRRQAAAIAPEFTAVPGLIAKTWLADPASNRYGGVYHFADRAALDGYLDSAIVAGLRRNPTFAEVAVLAFDTIGEATAITGGPLAEAGPVGFQLRDQRESRHDGRRAVPLGNQRRARRAK